jgi:uncharacterized repeat protein (TIGR03943 family)
VRVDWTRALRGTGLVAWAVFFDYLWLSGRSVDYVGPRTTWVVVFGAVALTCAAVLYVSGLLTRQEAPARPSVKELGRLVIIVSPIALAATAPSVTLGAQAVDQKRAADGATSLARLEAYDGSIRLYELAAAAYNPQWAVERGIENGLLVEIDGFVSKVRDDDTIELSRFLASCCAADAMPYSVDVTVAGGTAGLEKNEWLLVRGQVVEPASGKRKYAVAADEVEPIERPPDAYGG